MASASSGPEPVYDRSVSGYKTFRSDSALHCEWGGVLPSFELAYETWGTLSDRRDNVILLHTGLSASSHAKSHPENEGDGWWENVIGPGLAIDTNRFFVICTNLLGGCYGSTGPASTNPLTGEAYATDFPIITVRDMLQAQLRLLDSMGIEHLYASVGASLGGMQSLMLGSMAPERVDRLVSISATLRSYPPSIAMRFVQRQAVMNDPDWRDGRYYGKSFPYRGQKVAREMGTITYRSSPEWLDRFDDQPREHPPRLGADFEIEHYLEHQGEKFCTQYDANSYLYISKAMDLFNLMQKDEAGRTGYSALRAPTLVIGVTTDILFPVWQQREVAECLKKNGSSVRYVELDAEYGHDTFLIETDRIGVPLREHLETR